MKMILRMPVFLVFASIFSVAYAAKETDGWHERKMLSFSAKICISRYRIAAANEQHDTSENCHKELYKEAKQLKQIALKQKSKERKEVLTKLADTVMTSAFALPPKSEENVHQYTLRLKDVAYAIENAFSIADVELD